MSEMTTVPARIRHLGVCDHPQTPNARRRCRKAKLAAAALTLVAAPAYRAGDEIDIDGTVILLGTWKGRTGIRWTWHAPEMQLDGEAYQPTAEAAIANARTILTGPRCSCGAPATMNASTGRTCIGCYDSYAA